MLASLTGIIVLNAPQVFDRFATGPPARFPAAASPCARMAGPGHRRRAGPPPSPSPPGSMPWPWAQEIGRALGIDTAPDLAARLPGGDAAGRRGDRPGGPIAFVGLVAHTSRDCWPDRTNALDPAFLADRRRPATRARHPQAAAGGAGGDRRRNRRFAARRTKAFIVLVRALPPEPPVNSLHALRLGSPVAALAATGGAGLPGPRGSGLALALLRPAWRWARRCSPACSARPGPHHPAHRPARTPAGCSPPAWSAPLGMAGRSSSRSR